MLVSKTVPHLGRVRYPIGVTCQFKDLIREVGDYFDNGITIEPGDVVFDIGANIGAFALQANHSAGGGLQLYCFEPIPELFAALKRNCGEGERMSDSECHLFPMGLTAIGAPTEAEFTYFKRAPCDTTQHIAEKREELVAFFAAKGADAKALFERTLPGGIGRLFGRMAGRFVTRLPHGAVRRWVMDRVAGVRLLRCALTTVEAVVVQQDVTRIDLLKIDVEGAELEVLQGLGDRAWPMVRQIVLEGHDRHGRLDAIKRLLRERGFDDIHSEAAPYAAERALNNFVLSARRRTPKLTLVRPIGSTSTVRLSRLLRLISRREPCEV